MEKIIKFFIILIIFFTCRVHSQTTWSVQPTGVTDFLWNAHFVDLNTGYAVGGNARILKTTNGGAAWFPQASTASVDFIGVDFINAQTGWIAGHSGRILRTTDGGTIWNIQYNNPGIGDCFFVNAKSFNAVWVNTGSGVLFSSDGGINWNFQNSLVSWSLNFINSNYGWLGDLSGNQYRTTNGGAAWELTQYLPGYSAVWFDFVNVNTGWSVGYNNRIYRSTNGGSNWIAQPNTLSSSELRCIQINDPLAQYAWIAGFDNTIARTTNGGTNWVSQTTPVNTSYTYIRFVNANTGWAVGGNGTIIKTTDGGNPVGIEPVKYSLPLNYSLSQNFPNPFNPSTSIKFDIPKAGNVSLKIYDITGKEVYSVNEFKPAGQYEFTFDASNYASGLYFYKIEAFNFTATKKMLLVK